MADATVGLEELGDAIMVLCRDYADELEQQLRRDIDESARVVVDQLKSTSPKSGARRRHYASGWKASEDSDGLRGYGVRVHNTAKPGLTHLLEKGHGGPHPAGAHPHIAPAAQAGEAELLRRVSHG